MWVGAAVFLVGDKFLREIEHVNFVDSEGIGILSGVFLIALAALIGVAAKPPKESGQSQEKHPHEKPND